MEYSTPERNNYMDKDLKDLIKVYVQILTLELAVATVDVRFCTPKEFEGVTKTWITDPNWNWHPFYKTDKYQYRPHHHESTTVHCTKLGTLTKIRQTFKTSFTDEDAPVMILNSLQIKNYMKWIGGTVEDDEGYIVWLSDDDDVIIERVFPGKSYTAFYPLRISGKYYHDYREYLTWWKE